MRWTLSIIALVVLTHCSGVSDYTPDTGDRTSLTGNQGGTGVQASIWSTDPSKKTVTNQNGSDSP